MYLKKTIRPWSTKACLHTDNRMKGLDKVGVILSTARQYRQGQKPAKMILLILLWSLPYSLLGQDPNFAQFYTAPAFINPAFAGTTPHFRLTTLYRNQWPSIPGAYETNLFSFDYNWDYYNSGLAVLLSNNRVKEWGFQANSAALVYSYQARLSDDWVLRLGLKGGYVLRSYNFDQLTFADQFASGGPTAENFENVRQGYVDIGAGALLYSQNFWLGLSLDHITEPNLAFTGNGDIVQEFLPVQLSFHTGYKASWERGGEVAGYVQPIAAAYWQAGYSRADVGVNFALLPFVAGVWYRNISMPTNTFEGMPSTATVLAGLKEGHVSLTYSYDVGGGGLQGQTGGAHEISLTISPPGDYRYKGGEKWQLRGVECPVQF